MAEKPGVSGSCEELRFARFKVVLEGTTLAFWAAVDERTGSIADSVLLDEVHREDVVEAEGLGRGAFSDDVGENVRCGMVFESVLPLVSALRNSSLSPSCKALELGAGMGLPGMYVASQGVSVTLTDRHPGVLELLQRNLALNNLAARAEVKALSWECRPEWLDAGFDVAIAADVLYSQEAPPVFFAAVSAALRPGGTLVLAQKARGCVDLLRDALPAAAASGLELLEGDPSVDRGDICVLRFRRP
eukprot:TRINITY_DN104826_c0_g1_i1.p1 TRINITY_DN104826_c0_g1~~TRINITY_DN104826_c0_g1_i1.p1  ORF type:complete len:255 (-),score=51.56 TRINITY_DN104826_c0_g1_i1:440-1177(-)